MSKRSHEPEQLNPSEDEEDEQQGNRRQSETTYSEEALPSPSALKFHRVDDADMSENAAATANGGGWGEQRSTAMTCTIPGCKVKHFPDAEAYETHYAKDHTNRCHECRNNFPSQRILECHIKENHDMLSQLKKERGEKIYDCFVEGCEKVCSAPAKRRRHLIDKHYYPQEFNFYVVNDGIDKMRSLLRSPPRKSRTRIRSPSDPASSNVGTMEIDSVTGDGAPGSPTHRRKNSNTHKKKEKQGAANSKGDDAASKSNTEQGSNEATNGTTAPKEDVMEEEGELLVTNPETKGGQDDIMQDLSSKMATVSMVPRSVKFGRKGTGFAKK